MTPLPALVLFGLYRPKFHLVHQNAMCTRMQCAPECNVQIKVPLDFEKEIAMVLWSGIIWSEFLSVRATSGGMQSICWECSCGPCFLIWWQPNLRRFFQILESQCKKCSQGTVWVRYMSQFSDHRNSWNPETSPELWAVCSSRLVPSDVWQRDQHTSHVVLTCFIKVFCPHPHFFFRIGHLKC